VVASGRLQKFLFIELYPASHRPNFFSKLLNLAGDFLLIRRHVSVISGLNGKLPDALSHVVDFGNTALSNLDKRDSVLRVFRSHIQAPDLRSHLFGYCQACSVVSGGVNFKTRRKPCG